MGSIALQVSSSSIAVAQGASGSLAVTVVRVGNLQESVSLSVSGLPDGITAAVAPAQLPPPTSQAQISVTVVSTVTP